ncbi:hypothetical protein B7G68_21000 [Caulobacter segnis]|uniref:Lipoprotein n=3 Tax=Caulobacter segnis TaxID=88688 RepID=D5VPV2_CAUST|nr:conserved hypothetical protein [Caulobacter segnis ATCC 21756]AVQ04102.1 hypothetical protein B7G68_21000 [Caulobacter segnis]
MRAAAPIIAALLITACGPSPMGSPATQAPPADAPTAVAPDYAGDFDALGTEPFWSVKVRSAGLIVSRPDHQDIATTGTTLEVMGEEALFRARTDGQDFSLRLTPGECSDGMSDRRYDYLAEARIDGLILKGCASRPRDLATQPRP